MSLHGARFQGFQGVTVTSSFRFSLRTRRCFKSKWGGGGDHIQTGRNSERIKLGDVVFSGRVWVGLNDDLSPVMKHLYPIETMSLPGWSSSHSHDTKTL